MLLFVYYSTTLDNTNISTSNKGKTPISTNDVKTYSKETLGDEIHKLIIANVQLITDKMETEKARVNLETNRTRLFDEKNSLVVKRKEFRVEIAILYTVGFSNVPIRRYQDLFLRPIQDKFKAKRPPFFDGLKENFQRFFTRIRYYQGFYQQNLSFDFDKV